MKACPDCIPCIQRQILSAARKTTKDDWLHRKVLDEVMDLLREDDFTRPPAEIVYDALESARKVLGVPDPLAEDRAALNQEVVAQAGRLADVMAEAEDPLARALKLAAAGNVVDAAIFERVDPMEAVERMVDVELPTGVYEEFREDLEEAEEILYILDNAGEVVFDWVLLRRLGSDKEVTAVVRKGPVLHDVQREDIEQLGLDSLARVIDPGVETLGVPVAICSKEFKEAYEDADLILAKGSANYETLDEEPRPFYTVLLAKCDVVARHFGVDRGDLVFHKRA